MWTLLLKDAFIVTQGWSPSSQMAPFYFLSSSLHTKENVRCVFLFYFAIDVISSSTYFPRDDMISSSSSSSSLSVPTYVQ